MTKRKTVPVFLIAMAAAVAFFQPGYLSAELDEYQAKAMFLYNFSKFVEWPASAFSSPTAPLVIGVAGEDPFGASLDAVLKDKTVGERPLAAKRITGDAKTKSGELKGCHILFIASSAQADAVALIGIVKGAPVFTVSEVPRFAENGGMVNFRMNASKLELDLNVKAAEAAGLKVSARLQQVSKPVETVK